MKHIIPMLLALTLLLGLPAAAVSGTPAISAVEAPSAAGAVFTSPDFPALVARGNTVSTENAISVTCRGGLPAFYHTSCADGSYVLGQRADHSFAVYNIYGGLLWTPDRVPVQAEIYDGGFVTLYYEDGCKVFTPTGRQLSDDAYNMQYDFALQETGNGGHALLCNNVQHSATGRACRQLIFSSGKTIVAEQFGRFDHGRLTYQADGKWGAIDADGNELLPFTYDYLEFADDDILVCRKGDTYGLIRTDGAEVVPFQYENMQLLPEPDHRRVAVCQDGLWGVIDLSGAVHVPLKYAEVYASTPGINTGALRWYTVRRGGDSFHIAEDGAVTLRGSSEIPAKVLIDTADRFYEPQPGVNTKYIAVDAAGEPLPEIPVVYSVTMFGDGYYLLVYHGDTGTSCGHIYDLDMTLLAEVPNARSSAEQYQGFGWTEDALAIQTIDYAFVYIYSHDGKQLGCYQSAYLARVINGNTIVLKKKVQGTYLCAFSDKHGTAFTDFLYFSVGRVGTTAELVLAVQGSREYLMHNSGRQLLDNGLFGFNFPLDKDSGCNHFQTYDDEQVGLLYICPIGTSFADAPASAWFHGGVEFCANAGLMNGVGSGLFAPNTAMTRAMLVRVLYNLSGGPSPSHGFVDVADGTWYTDAVNWAAANGIVYGVDETHFAPNAPVTREQMVTILCRYAQRFGNTLGNADALAAFADADEVSAYARGTMCWAVSIGLINGKTPTTLVPKGQATRAEIATVLMRFVTYMASRSADE